METKNIQEATACLDAIGDLARSLPGFVHADELTKAIVPMRVLLTRAEALVDGSTGARERKNAGDRKRRAKKTAPGTKRRTKNPRARANKPGTVLVNAG